MYTLYIVKIYMEDLDHNSSSTILFYMHLTESKFVWRIGVIAFQYHMNLTHIYIYLLPIYLFLWFIASNNKTRQYSIVIQSRSYIHAKILKCCISRNVEQLGPHIQPFWKLNAKARWAQSVIERWGVKPRRWNQMKTHEDTCKKMLRGAGGSFGIKWMQEAAERHRVVGI